MNFNWIELIGAVGAIAAAGAAWFAIRHSSKQLNIEQTPYVVLDKIHRNNGYEFIVKNIGRGPAINITCCESKNEKDRNNGFFSDDQPHSVNLESSGKSEPWHVDGERIDNLERHEDTFSFVYIFFESQSNALYRTTAKIKRSKSSETKYTVMTNEFEKIGERLKV